jgi:hypothetical protein
MSPRKIHALLFELVHGDRECFLVVWSDENQPKCGVPPHGQHWLDVGVGDLLTQRGERWFVSRVLLYRVHPAQANGILVRTGRAWLRCAAG